MPQEEAQQYLNFLKKAFSGAPGKNLTDIVFTTEQVMDSEEHRLLMSLREDKAEARQTFFQKVIENLDMGDSNYLILCANDAYDVPYHKHDDFDRSAQEYDVGNDDQVYRYFVCAICPVKDGKLELGYYSGENEFHNCLAKQIVSAPELGFLFPAFDDRAANIYHALFYTKDSGKDHRDFVDAVFHTEAPIPAGRQKELFGEILSESLEADCSFDVVQAVHEQLSERMVLHKESKDPEPLTLTEREMGDILESSGVSPEHAEAFCARCTEELGEGTPLRPANISSASRMDIQTPEVKISVDPKNSHLIQTRVIDGHKYILISADAGVELNGLAVEIRE